MAVNTTTHSEIRALVTTSLVLFIISYLNVPLEVLQSSEVEAPNNQNQSVKTQTVLRTREDRAWEGRKEASVRTISHNPRKGVTCATRLLVCALSAISIHLKGNNISTSTKYQKLSGILAQKQC